MIDILNSYLKKIDILRKYTYLQYTDSFRTSGSITVYAELVEENKRFFDEKEQFYFLIDNKIFGRIDKINKSEEDETKIIITGKLALCLLSQRVLKGTYKYSGKTCDRIKWLIQKSITEDVQSDGYIDIDVQLKEEEYLRSICSNVDKEVTGGYLYDAVYEDMLQDRLGILLTPVVTTKQVINGNETNIPSWQLVISGGVDRRKGNTQGNKPVVFSQTYSNIDRTSYERDSESYCNVAIVAGEGEDADRKWYSVGINEEVPINNNKGWGYRELWIDARDIQSESEDGTQLTDQQYEELIKQRSNEKAAENTRNETYTATIREANKQYRYGVDYYKGDLVSVIDNDLGIIVDAQITDVTVTVTGSKEIIDVDFTYGSINRDPVKQIGTNIDNTNKNANDIKYLENKINRIGKPIELPITLNNENCSAYSGGVYYYKELGLCVCNVRVTRAFTASGTGVKVYELFSIPEEYIDGIVKSLSVYAMISNADASVYGYIGSTGVVAIRMLDSTNTTYFYVSGVWSV